MKQVLLKKITFISVQLYMAASGICINSDRNRLSFTFVNCIGIFCFKRRIKREGLVRFEIVSFHSLEEL
jgi:hypothetical protein